MASCCSARPNRFDLSDPGQLAIFEELRDRLTGRELQIHGLEVAPGTGAGTPNEINGTGGYRAPLPVANGVVLSVDENTRGGVADVVGLFHSAFDGSSGDAFGAHAQTWLMSHDNLF